LSLLSFLFFVALGILLIYRGTIPESALKRIDGILKNAETLDGYGNVGRNYAILLNLEGESTLYGINAGTKEQALKKEKALNLTAGKSYSFYVDRSVSIAHKNVNLGVRVIKQGNNIVYQESMKAHIVFGMILIFMGVISSGLFYFLGKKKFG